jgi:[phosphatase 2A protein]-leucine-carboxy methyltransferase
MDSFVTPSTPIITTTTINNNAFAMDASDLAVIGTADDAIFAKLATVQAKYYQDPFLECFLPRVIPPSRQPQGGRRNQPPPPQVQRHTQPIIKRGTHARVCCMDRAILAALESVSTCPSNSSILQNSNDSTTTTGPDPQSQHLMVVCLGSGKDTTFFRYWAGLLQGQQASTTSTVLEWYEIDHPVLILEKIQMIERCPLLSSEWKVVQAEEGDGCCFGLVDANGHVHCHFIGHDLRNSPNELVQRLLQSKRTAFPTQSHHTTPVLFTMECVQMYLPDQASRNLWQALADSFPNSCLAIYDAIIGDDPFGKMMEQNLLEAGVVAKAASDDTMTDDTTSSLLQTRTLTMQMTKLLDCGWTRVVGCDMGNAYQSVITTEQRRHANRCELLDEVEEWILIMKHYSFVIATTSDNNNEGWGAHFCQIGTTSPMGFQQNLCQVHFRFRL